MTFHSGGDCWEILRAVGSGGERKSLVILRYFHPWPDLSAQYILGICLYVEEFYVPNFISFHKPTPLFFQFMSSPMPQV